MKNLGKLLGAAAVIFVLICAAMSLYELYKAEKAKNAKIAENAKKINS